MNFFQKNAGGLACILLLAGCEKNIQVTVPDFPPKLVLYSINTGEADSIRVMVKRTAAILTYSAYQDLTVTDATVQLLDDGQPAATLLYDHSRNAYQSGIRPVPGHRYTLRVTAPGFTDTAAASAQLPERVPFTVERQENVRLGRYGDPLDELILRFTDAAATTDYYRVSILNYYGSEKRPLYSCIQATDPSIDKITRDDDCQDAAGIYLKDELFNGSAKTLRLYIPHNDLERYTDTAGNTQYAVVQLEHLAPDYYRYLQGYYYMWQNDGNPFAEPANVPTNVQGGYGFFTITAADHQEVP